VRDLELPAVESPALGVDEGVPERFDPRLMRGRLIEAEHVGRYWWASQFVRGKRVLDAGCGTGYGASALAQGGAREVIGVDIDEEMLEAARAEVHPSVQLRAADIRQLPFEDDSFDTIVCFETIEHVEHPELAFEEFARVLGDGGLLVISSPNRDEYPPGNPHHRHEYVPEELETVLGEHFANVRLFRQHDWFASAVFDDIAYASEAEDPLERVEVRKVAGRRAGSELYTLALASDARLPRPASLAVLTHTAELRELTEGFEELERHQRERAPILRELARLQSDVAAARERDAAIAQRMLELEAEVANARQASEQDAYEAAQARAKADRVQAEFEGLHAELARLHTELERLGELTLAMRSTRVWRLGESFWRFKAALLRRPSGRP
jgi:ubiquinone/menaquinone biosynthesis C-methylase UbiE